MLGAFKINTLARLIQEAILAGNFGLYKVLDNPNAYSNSQGDNFGYCADISELYSIVGAYGEDDAGGTSSGKAYIYENSTGSLLYTLDNPNAYDTPSGDNFGFGVSICDTHAIVGAYGEQDGRGVNSGKAYIYSTSTGSLLYTLDAPATNPYGGQGYGQSFGWSVGINSSYIIVGAKGTLDSNGNSKGAAYIYSTSTGSLLYTLTSPDTSIPGFFGSSVDISDSYTIVGNYAAGATGYEGKAYIYENSTGSLLYTLSDPNPYSIASGDYFAFSCAITESYAIVGAYQENDAGGSSSGKAYIYSTSTGSLLYTLDNPNAYSTSSLDQFGKSVGINELYSIVGAPQEDEASGSESGKAYIYENSTGSLLYTLDNPNAYGSNTSDGFGSFAAMSESYAIVGAVNEDDAGRVSSGKAYIYNQDEGSHITVNPTGIAFLVGATSQATTITIPTTVAVGDLLVLFDTSTTVSDVTPSGWTSISKVTTTGIRTNISYKVAVSGDSGSSITGMAGTTRKVMQIFRNSATNSITVGTISTPGAQATTAVPTNQTITGGTKPCIYFACYAKTAALTPTRGWTGLPTGVTFTATTSVSSSGVYVQSLVYDSGLNSNNLVDATISMTDAGTNTLQSFRMNVS